MKKPGWKSWIAGVAIWALFYWITGALIHRHWYLDHVLAAVESGLAGGTLMWWFGWRKWQEKQRKAINCLPATDSYR